jgi:WD40 repeat protein
MKNSILTTVLLMTAATMVLAQKATLVMPMGHARKVIQMDVSHDHKYLASIDSSNNIIVWEIESGRELFHFRDKPEGMSSIDFHPSQYLLLSGTQGGNIQLWDLTKSKLVRTISAHTGGVRASFAKGGQLIASAGTFDIRTWNASDGSAVKTVKVPDQITHFAVGEAFGVVAVGTITGKVYVYNLEDLSEAWSVQIDNGAISHLSFYVDKPKFIVGTTNGLVASVHTDKKEIIEKVKVFNGSVGNLLIDEVGGFLMAAGNDKTGYIKFLKSTSFENITSKKFKWSSTPKDNVGLFGLAWGNKENTNLLIANHDNVIESWDLKKDDWVPTQFKGFARPVNMLSVNFNGKLMALASDQKRLKIMDLTGASPTKLLDGHSGGILSVDFHNDRDLVITTGNDGQIGIWNPEKFNAETMQKFSTKSPTIFISGRRYIRDAGNGQYELVNTSSNEIRKIPVSGARTFKPSPDGQQFLFMTRDGITILSQGLAEIAKIPVAGIADFTFAGNQLLGLTNDKKVFLIENNVATRSLNIEVNANRIYGLSDGSFLTYQTRALDGQIDFGARHYNSRAQLLTTLTGHQDFIMDMKSHNQSILTASQDGSIKIWQKPLGLQYKEVATIIPLRNEDYVVTTPSQLFDASPTAMNSLHYAKDGQVISLEQLKDLYYEPDLLAKLMGFNPEPIREIQDLSSVKIYPEFDLLHPKDNNGKIGIRLKDQGGGIGRVVLTINGKEVSNDIRSAGKADEMINYDIQGHPYLKDGLNKITIKAYNSDGNLASEGKNIYVMQETSAAGSASPKVYAIIVGSSDYIGDNLDLKYAAKDAFDFAEALKMAAGNLLTPANVEVRLLTTELTDPNSQPNKANIKKAFADISKKAKAKDYLVVYMAGHGVNFTDAGKTDFFYLTSAAKSDNLDDPIQREKVAISSTELTDLFKSVAALKQVLIMDACHSGSINMEARDQKTMSSAEVRALERMKDRTGLFILAGSASDAVSYEASLYGQGLLTYSLLFGMKGAALRNGEFVDVVDLFQFAAKKVPQLAADIGGIQRPEIRMPSDAQSFDLGLLKDEHKAKIVIKSPKPVFVQTNFQENKDYDDKADLGSLVDSKLIRFSSQPDAPIFFVNEKKFSGALVVRGRYDMKDEEIKVELKVFRDGKLLGTISDKGANANVLAEKLTNQLIAIAEKNK